MTAPPTDNFEHLLDEMERAAIRPRPFAHGYAEKRQAVVAYVADLEARAASPAPGTRALIEAKREGARAMARSFKTKIVFPSDWKGVDAEADEMFPFPTQPRVIKHDGWFYRVDVNGVVQTQDALSSCCPHEIRWSAVDTVGVGLVTALAELIANPTEEVDAEDCAAPPAGQGSRSV